MNVKINPSIAKGTVKAPASKSMAHRYLIGSYLAGENCTVEAIEESGDMKATLACLEALGAEIKYDKASKLVTINGQQMAKEEETVLNCNESGSTLRFMIPICLTMDKEITLTGTEKLFSRPLSVYEDICNEQNIKYIKNGNKLTVKGRLKAGEYKVQGNISSQFITGLLFALSRLEEDSVISLIPPVESRSYINMTLEVLQDFGVEANWQDELSLLIKGNQTYKAGYYQVEGDYSNAAFLDVFNYLDGSVETKGLKENSLQGDRVYREHFETLNKENAVIDITDCPDLGPILFAFAALKNGAEFTGTKRLKIKESDRAEAMRQELEKCGAMVEVYEDNVIVKKNQLNSPESVISSHNDHRIVMAMATVLSVIGGEIEGAEAVNKSFPDYYDMIESLGIVVKRL